MSAGGRRDLRAAPRTTGLARSAWREKLLERRIPSTRRTRPSVNPIVTSAITHGLSLAGELFLDPGDVMLLPDKLWGNYRLTFEVHHGAEIQTFPFYKPAAEGGGMDTDAFADPAGRSCAEGRDKVVVLLNFPNNPTGYMPTPDRGRSALAAALEAQAERRGRGSSCSATTRISGSSITWVASR